MIEWRKYWLFYKYIFSHTPIPRTPLPFSYEPLFASIFHLLCNCSYGQFALVLCKYGSELFQLKTAGKNVLSNKYAHKKELVLEGHFMEYYSYFI